MFFEKGEMRKILNKKGGGGGGAHQLLLLLLLFIQSTLHSTESRLAI